MTFSAALKLASLLASLLAALASCTASDSPSPALTQHVMGTPRMPGACEAPGAANAGKMGCYFDVAINLGAVPDTVFWHIDEFSDAASAERAKGAGGAVVLAYGRTFLQTVNGDAKWQAAGGRRLSTIGPLQAPDGRAVTARFMQAMTEPGAMTRPHRHSGPEAFYILSGAICLETPDGPQTIGAGQTLEAAAGVPMQLTSAGRGVRRSLFIVLHPTSQPWMMAAPDWTPKGACAEQH